MKISYKNLVDEKKGSYFGNLVININIDSANDNKLRNQLESQFVRYIAKPEDFRTMIEAMLYLENPELLKIFDESCLPESFTAGGRKAPYVFFIKLSDDLEGLKDRKVFERLTESLRDTFNCSVSMGVLTNHFFFRWDNVADWNYHPLYPLAFQAANSVAIIANKIVVMQNTPEALETEVDGSDDITKIVQDDIHRLLLYPLAFQAANSEALETEVDGSDDITKIVQDDIHRLFSVATHRENMANVKVLAQNAAYAFEYHVLHNEASYYDGLARRTI